MPLVRSMLDAATCEACEQPVHPHPIYLHGRCHPASPSWVSYDEGVLTVECAECRGLIAKVSVAND